jgi:hypothetical protein
MVDTTSSDLNPVILWGDEFSSWLGVLDELKLRPIAVILLGTTLIDLVCGCVGADCFVGLATDMDENVLLSLRGLSKLGLVDGRVTSQIGASASTLALECLIGTTGPRRPIPGWCHDTWAFSHCEVGGGDHLVHSRVLPSPWDTPSQHIASSFCRVARCEHITLPHGALA